MLLLFRTIDFFFPFHETLPRNQSRSKFNKAPVFYFIVRGIESYIRNILPDFFVSIPFFPFSLSLLLSLLSQREIRQKISFFRLSALSPYEGTRYKSRIVARNVEHRKLCSSVRSNSLDRFKSIEFQRSDRNVIRLTLFNKFNFERVPLSFFFFSSFVYRQSYKRKRINEMKRNVIRARSCYSLQRRGKNIVE